MTEDRTSITLTRRIEASPERVFDAWIDPALIAKWMLSPAGDDRIIHVKTDARAGGRFSFKLLRQGQEIDHFGEYVEVERPRRLVFTFDAVVGDAPLEPRGTPTLITVALAALPGGATELTLTAARIPREYAERTESGWNKIAEAVARIAAG